MVIKLSTSPTSGESKQLSHWSWRTTTQWKLSTSPTSGASKQLRPSKPFSTDAFSFIFAKGRKYSLK
ncbi:MAG: hypothetical protein ACRC2S_20505 [Waterburya sp.]